MQAGSSGESIPNGSMRWRSLHGKELKEWTDGAFEGPLNKEKNYHEDRKQGWGERVCGCGRRSGR